MVKRGKIGVLILLVVTVGASAGGREAARLQLRPEIGKKQTMRITTRVVTTPPGTSNAGPTEHRWVLTLELEPLAIAADGAVTVKATFVRIQHKASGSRQGKEILMFDLDSADEKSRYEPRMAMCLAPIGESFTAVVSAQGRIEKVDVEAYCAAVGRKQMQYEDEAIRHETIRVKEWGYRDKDEATRRQLLEADVQKAIRAKNDRHGSAAQRVQAYTKGASESYLFSMLRLRWLLHDVLIPFSPAPVAPGSRWNAPVMVRAEGPIELKGTFTLQDQDSSTCTIQVEARRTRDDYIALAPAVPEAHRTRLAGTYQATVRLDRTTGVVLSKEASMDLTGDTSTLAPGITKDGMIVPITTKITTTVEMVP